MDRGPDPGWIDYEGLQLRIQFLEREKAPYALLR